MNTKKIGTLFLISILSLATIGISYAGYIDVITITGTVTTGTVDIDLEYVEGTWVWKNIENHHRNINYGLATPEDIPEDDDNQPGDDFTANQETPSWYTDPNMLLYSYVTAFNDSQQDDLIHIKWDNITPIEGIEKEYVIKLKLHYVGKTPARIQKDGIQFVWDAADLIDIDGQTGVNWIQWLLENEYIEYTFVFADENGEPTEYIVDECTQLHYCDRIWLIIKGEIPQRQEFQGLQGHLGLTINLIQFDEADCDEDPCDGAIGDYVWEDLDRDGSQDINEPSVGGVTVNLLDAANQLLATTVTDSSGFYLFSGLEPGIYKVEFILPSGYLGFTTKHASGVPSDLDSDPDTATGVTDPITLDCDEINLDIDAGLLSDIHQEEACIMILKTLYGAYTDPVTGDDLIDPIDQIAIGADFSTKFILELCVTNCGPVPLQDIVVLDFLGPLFTISDGLQPPEILWDEFTNEITWIIPELLDGETICIQIPIETIEFEDGIYHPICSEEICLVAIDPEDGATVPSLVHPDISYFIENPSGNPFHSIKFETVGEGIRDGNYDIFEFTLDQDPGIFDIDVELKRGNSGNVYVTVTNVGDIASSDDFTVEFLYINDNGDGTYTYGFNVTNDNDEGGAALSHVAFRLPCVVVCDEIIVNDGAEVTAYPIGCSGPLYAKTEQILLNICCIDNGIGTLQPTLPYSTPYAMDTCTVSPP